MLRSHGKGPEFITLEPRLLLAADVLDVTGFTYLMPTNGNGTLTVSLRLGNDLTPQSAPQPFSVQFDLVSGADATVSPLATFNNVTYSGTPHSLVTLSMPIAFVGGGGAYLPEVRLIDPAGTVFSLRDAASVIVLNPLQSYARYTLSNFNYTLPTSGVRSSSQSLPLTAASVTLNNSLGRPFDVSLQLELTDSPPIQNNTLGHFYVAGGAALPTTSVPATGSVTLSVANFGFDLSSMPNGTYYVVGQTIIRDPNGGLSVGPPAVGTTPYTVYNNLPGAFGNATGGFPSATTLAASPAAATTSDAVDLSATVIGVPAPTGTVRFFDNGNFLGSTLVNPSGNATLSGVKFSPGTHVLTASYLGDATHGPSDSPALAETVTLSPATHAAHQAYVSQIYQDLLHRAADAGGLATFTGLLDGGASLQQVAGLVTSSAEYDADVINGYYQNYLGRSADAAGLNAWVTLVSTGGATLDTVRAGILGSDEFYAHAGGTAQSFVTGLYGALLNRSPDSTGSSTFTGALAAGLISRTDLANLIALAPEARGVMVQAAYGTYLGRAGTAGEVSSWVTYLTLGVVNTQTLPAAFVSSGEYLTKHGITV